MRRDRQTDRQTRGQQIHPIDPAAVNKFDSLILPLLGMSNDKSSSATMKLLLNKWINWKAIKLVTLLNFSLSKKKRPIHLEIMQNDRKHVHQNIGSA